jgi:hypothetical protein
MKFKEEDMSLLTTEICNLPVSKSFIARCETMGFKTLGEITDKGWISLMQNKKFTYRWFGELMKLLESRKLEHLLLVKQGISH